MKRNMKIGIVTLYGNTNYGNRLQNYAIQEILKQRGFEVETLVCCRNEPKALLRKNYHAFMSLIGEKKSKRMTLFNHFNKEMVRTRIIHEKSGLFPQKLADEYDYFISGSDQVWNPDIRLNEKDNFFLRFARREQRICLAPSIASEDIPQTCLTEYQIGLNGFPYLSCREKSGAELVTQLTGKCCENIIDPTMAIDAKTWREFSKPVSQKKPYIFMFFLGTIPDYLRALARQEAKKRNLDVVELSSSKDRHFLSDPRNFVWLIDHAELVLTDSFHGAAFSINLNTPFYVFSRSAVKNVEKRISSRISALTDKFCLSDRYVKDTINHLDYSCCFMQTNAVLEEERSLFHKYLDRCLLQKSLPIHNLPDRQCTGCGLCKNVCVTGCIEMKFDAEGFLRPELDHSQCISCTKCISACPVLHKDKTATNELQQIFAAVCTDPEKLNGSSSGAVFPLIAEWIIGQNGVVFGAAFDCEFNVTHDWAATSDGIRRFYTSKYVQSNITECFAKAESFLNNGQWVLFSGTPCQIAAIRSYLCKDYKKLILIECACHGVPSPKVWRLYRKYLSVNNLQSQKIRYVNFREKIDGKLFFLRVCSQNDNYVGSLRTDLFMKGFLNNLTLRPSCTACSFKGIQRTADITLADFWGIKEVCPEFLPQEGCSMVMINSEKGMNLWKNIINDDLHVQRVDKDKVIGKVNSAIWQSVPEHINRRIFFNSLDSTGIETSLMVYGTPQKLPFTKRVFRKLRKILMHYV